MSRAWDKHRAGALSTELRRTLGVRGHILGSYLTRVLHTAWISNVEIVLYGERMKDGKFLSSVNIFEDEIINMSLALSR